MVYKRGEIWWYEFIYAERRVRESAKTSGKTIAIESERNRRLELEKTLSGMPVEKRENRINSVSDVVKQYQKHYDQGHRPHPFCSRRGALLTFCDCLGVSYCRTSARSESGSTSEPELMKVRAGGPSTWKSENSAGR